MTSPRLVHGGLVTMDAGSGVVLRVFGLQYNPDTLTRTLQPQATGGDAAERTEPLRFRAPAVETLSVEIEIDLTDELEHPGQARSGVDAGIHPQLAALEGLVNPTADGLAAGIELARSGGLEILPVEAPLTVFVWGRHRVVPVRLTQVTVTEEAFDAELNPIRARVGLAMRVLTVDDLGAEHRGGTLYLAQLRGREQLAGRVTGSLAELGISGI